MSILTDVLTEELDRCQRIKKVYLARLKEPNLLPEDRERFQLSLQQNNENMYRIKRAMDPVPSELPEED